MYLGKTKYSVLQNPLNFYLFQLIKKKSRTEKNVQTKYLTVYNEFAELQAHFCT